MDRRLGKFKTVGRRRARLRRPGADTQFWRQQRSRPQAHSTASAAPAAPQRACQPRRACY